MSSTNPKSDGRLLSNLFFRVLPAQIFLVMLTRINNIVDGLVGYAIVALCGPVYAILFWKRIPRTLSEWVTIPEDFGAAEEERLDASIHSLEEAMTISSEVQRFCEERADFIDPKDDSPKSMSIRLFMGIVKETEYQLTLGINVFTVTV